MNPKTFPLFLVESALCCVLSRNSCAQLTGYIGSQQGQVLWEIQTDKAQYNFGDTVLFNLTFNSIVDSCTLHVRYSHLGYVVAQDSLDITSVNKIGWSWTSPHADYRGYFVDIFLTKAGLLLDHASTAVDVSSTWNRFPRYGFLSSYPFMQQTEMDSVAEVLNRYHINGLQFYDWQYKHNMPLKGTPQAPAPYWNDIANRINYFTTVSGYIQTAHAHAMKAMSYNLCYGAYANADQDGVATEWSLYKDTNHQTREVVQLPSGWASNIYLMDPSNAQWRAYLLRQEDSAFEALAFDGWQIDQLGDWGPMYNYAGQPVVVSNSFTSFIQGAKSYLNKDMVMNAVNQYGQSNIAQAPVDFLYSEVWDPSVNYSDLVSIINTNYALSGGHCSTVLAAYMDYNLGDNPGWFSTPGVLMTDAVIFASGGAHIELGEHMLCKEYFPNGNLQMTNELKGDLVHYYDFLTAYENLLRDSVRAATLQLFTSSGAQISSVQQLGALWYFVKQKNNLQILHLLNYTDAASLQWRDRYGTQPEPDTVRNVTISFSTDSFVKRVWTASPDFYGGADVDLSFTQDSGRISFTLPQIKYWDMVVIEYDSTLTGTLNRSSRAPVGYALGQNYPNPFNPTTVISYSLPVRTSVTLRVYDVLGKEIATLVDERQNAGIHSTTFDAGGLSSGVYFYRLTAGSFVETKKLMLMK